VQSERYLLECYRYVELNPVEAGMVRYPGDYAWSSYAANVGDAHSELITPHEEYLRLGKSAEVRTQAYRALFDAPLASERVEAIRAATNGNFALGDKSFRDSVSAALGRRAEPGRAGRPTKKQVDAAQMDLLADEV
jgi:putative transposase